MNTTTKKPAYLAPSRAGKVNLAIWTDPERRTALKHAALDDGISVQEYVERAIDEKLARSKSVKSSGKK